MAASTIACCNAGLQPNPDTVEVPAHHELQRIRPIGGRRGQRYHEIGTNRLRSSLYDYLRNDDLDSQLLPASVTKLRQNQFGGSLGSPIRGQFTCCGSARTGSLGVSELGALRQPPG